METNLTPFGIDAGNGAFKLYGAPGGLEFISQAATNGTQKVLSTLGLRKSKAPLAIHNESGSFYVGAGAHDFGRPVENLDVDRFNGTPEMKALLHGSLTRYQQRYGKFSASLSVVVGLPNEVLTGDQAEQNIESAKRWLRGIHTWTADGEPYSVEIADVKAASQVTGGLFDYLLDTRNRVLDIVEVYHGCVNASQIRIAEVFKPAIQRMAPAIICCHNHPSGDCGASPDDLAVTRALVQAGKLLDIQLLDHLIIGKGAFVSLREKGLGFS